MKSTGAVQVLARVDHERVRLPVNDAIIMPLDSMIISPQRAMVGDINHSNNNRDQSANGGVSLCGHSDITSQKLLFTCCLSHSFSIAY